MAAKRSPAADFVLEIGTEEIPARFLDPARAQLEKAFRGLFEQQNIALQSLAVFATPCRLAVCARKLAARASDREVERTGPPAERAYDEQGNPTPALDGFLKANNAKISQLARVEKKGKIVMAIRSVEKGRPTADILAESIPAIITALHFPKNMRWLTGNPASFARPVRWLVCLHGPRAIRFDALGCSSGNVTRGNKFFHPAPIRLSDASGYERRLEMAKVIVSQDRRRESIAKQILALQKKKRYRQEADESLLSEVVYLTEYPTVLVGDFNPDYLQVPDVVLKTAMRHHQRYFPLTEKSGKLAPHFLIVRNGPKDVRRTVARGNERVLAARFADAKYFFANDRKMKLADRVDGLKRVVYMQGLGSMHDHCERMRGILVALASQLQMSIDLTQYESAAYLCKADLLTEMVYEFPELQGVIGRLYATLDGVPDDVAQAVLEHYQPRGAQDPLPATLIGTLLSLSDKVALLVGAYSINVRASAQADPFGLRRSALGILRILLERRWHLPFRRFLESAAVAFPDPAKTRGLAGEIFEFVVGRLESLLIERGLPREVVNACLRMSDDPADVLGRAEAMSALLKSDPSVWTTLMHTAKRAHAIIKDQKDLPPVRPELFEAPEEKALHAAFGEWSDRQKQASKRDYDARLRAIASMAAPLGLFFEKVFVMVENEDVKRNRLALLRDISDAFRSYAQFDRVSV